MADALGLPSAGHATRALTELLQQDPSVPMQDYDFHSDDIITTLEELLQDFKAEKANLDEIEVKSVAEQDAYVQEKTDAIKAANGALEKTKQERKATMAEIARTGQRLSTTSAVLIEDITYMKELAKMCHERAPSPGSSARRCGRTSCPP